MKRYDSYKDSGVEWIGEVPSHWKVLRLKFAYIFKTGATPSSGKKEYYGGDYKWANIGDLTSKYVDDTAKHITKEAISSCSMTINPIGTLMYSFKLSVGTVAFCSDEMYSNEAIASFIPQKNNLDYLYYAAPVFIIHNSNRNIYNAPILNQDLIKNAIICLCPKYEQEQIASYLNSKCGEIDKVISTQEKRIALLQELKQSIITNAVTKGLNPDAKMKDSGIEWIGEVPEHWEVCKIKNILIKGKNGIKIGPFGSSLTGNVGEGLPYKLYGQWNIIDRDFTAGTNTINQNVYNRLSNYKVVEGDILVSMMGTIGKCATVPKNIKDGVMDSHVVKISLNKSLFDNRYFEYFYDKDYSNIAFNEINKLKGGSIMDGLNSSIIKNLSITVPPLYEQQEIASYLDKRCAQIDASICKAKREIELLQEYKQSLITEVVTGKRKVC